MHAASAALRGSTTLRVAMAGSTVSYQLMGLAAANKDVSPSRSIYNDTDMWVMHCNSGYMCSAGRRSRGTAPQRDTPLEIVYDQSARSVTFRQADKVLGRAEGLPDAVKLVVSLGSQGNAAKIVD